MSRHLIHIGFPKAGSTSLEAWFASHPQCAFVHEGVGGYRYASEIASGAAARRGTTPLWNVTSCELLSTPLTPDAGSLQDLGEEALLTPISELRERVCLELQRMFAQPAILIVTRGFHAEFLSGYSQYVRGGGRLRIEELFAPEAAGHVAAFFDYDSVVSLYERTFGEEAVIVLPYELMREDPSAFVAVLEGRLGLESQGISLPALNPSLSPAAIYWYRRLSVAVAGVGERAGPRIGSKLWPAYVGRIDRDRFSRAVRLMHRLLPSREVTSHDVPEEAIEACRGQAARLGEREIYAPYATEYLNEEPVRQGLHQVST